MPIDVRISPDCRPRRHLHATAGSGPDPEAYGEWAVFAERAGLTQFQAKLEAALIDDWEVLCIHCVHVLVVSVVSAASVHPPNYVHSWR